MCRLFAITSKEPLSPMVAIEALNVMREGHDGSGVGLFLRGLSGPFEDMKDAPILSGIFSEAGLKRLDAFMMDVGFMTKYKISIKVPKTPPVGVPRRDVYLIRAYEYPEEWEGLSPEELRFRLLTTRLKLRAMGEEKEDMIVFSFWPDAIMIKEIGDPLAVARHLQLDRKELAAISALFKKRSFPKGETVIKEGSGGAAFYLIESGEAAVTIGGELRATLGPGDYFGEVALAMNIARTASVRAMTPAVVASCDKATFDEFLRPLFADDE